MRGAAGVQPHHAPAVRTACFPPGRRESRAPGEKGHAMLGGEDTVQPTSRPPPGATVLPDGFCHQASLFLHGTKTLLGWSGRVCSWLCQRQWVLPGISRHSCSHGPDPALASLLLPPPRATQPSQPCQVSLSLSFSLSPLVICPGRKQSRSSCHGLAGKPVPLPGTLPPCADRTCRGKV